MLSLLRMLRPPGGSHSTPWGYFSWQLELLKRFFSPKFSGVVCRGHCKDVGGNEAVCTGSQYLASDIVRPLPLPQDWSAGAQESCRLFEMIQHCCGGTEKYIAVDKIKVYVEVSLHCLSIIPELFLYFYLKFCLSTVFQKEIMKRHYLVLRRWMQSVKRNKSIIF